MKITRDMIRAKFRDLQEEKVPREEIASFAQRVMSANDIGELEIAADNTDRIWRAITYLSGVDLQDAPGEYIHCREDFAEFQREIGLV